MSVLLLAGTAEARKVAERSSGVDMIASFAGATVDPADLPVPVRIGGFGGAEGFREFLADRKITAVLDATHPFASKMTRTAASVSAAAGLPYCLLLRPPWTPEPGDRWTRVACLEEVPSKIPPHAQVFLATGRQSLAAMSDLRAARILCRVIDPPLGPFPLPNGAFLQGRPPFSVADEVSLFREHGIDVLVVKNAGGAASRSKLLAARELGMRVVIVDRPPPPPDAKIVASVDAALAWLDTVPS